MDKFRNYEVSFSGLKDGKHRFEFEIDEKLFELFESEGEFTRPRLTAEVLLDKHSTFLEFWIDVKGLVELECDITSVRFDHPIEHHVKVLVKFGETYDDSNEEVITIPSSDHSFNLAQLLYESVMLSIPMKKISPEVSKEDWELLEKYSLKQTEEEPETETEDESSEVDPRWEALKKLKDKN